MNSVSAAFFVYKNVEAQMDRLQQARQHWTGIKLSYSLYLTFAGVIVNILATVTFLTLLLLREERKAAKSTKGLGVCATSTSETARLKPNDALERNNKNDTTELTLETSKAKTQHRNTVSVSVISGANYNAYDNACYSSMQHSFHAGPSDDDDFNHIHIESSRL